MIETTHLFPVLDQKLIELLQSLSPEDWNKQTVAKLWTVKDIAAHLLDGNLRTLSLSRDKHRLVPPTEIHTYHDLVDYVNGLNAEWVTASKRLSSHVITKLLEITGKEYSAYLATLDPYAQAIFSVAWAGEKVSKNWFHVAREYTEKWHHQQQIREATGKQGIMTKELFYPAIDTFMYGLPYAYRNTYAETGSIVQVTIESEIGGDWFLIRTDNGWELSKKYQPNITSSISIHPDIAWKLFTRAITSEKALSSVAIRGDQTLATVALKLVAVMV
ncbi:MAG TPA: maleylpyruvate isomerase N-terminal domain-containing protein [Flavitalea sp.]|nr:maleylpyruvate isomerase N-terminal domain-containing protein [Flavitalea sp.]